MIKLIVSDLDGTLLTRYKSISKANVEALLQAQARGVKVALATGRGFDSTHQFIKTLRLDHYQGYLIVNNGQRVYEAATSKNKTHGYIRVEQARKVMELAQKYKLQLILDGETGLAFYSPKELEIYRDIYRLLIKVLPYFRPILGRIHIFSLFGFLKNQPVTILRTPEDIRVAYDKMGIAHMKHQIDQHEVDLKRSFASEFEVMRVSSNWVDVSPKGITKLTGIEDVMQREQLKPDEVMVMGDSENDVTMLKAFDNSVAMANAAPDIKRHANYITLSNQEDGVAHAIYRYVLNLEHDTSIKL